jgi:hypothetical protein
MDKPHFDCDLNALARACDERAGELHTRAWRSEAERNALREATADLLSAVARKLSAASQASSSMPDCQRLALSASDLRDMIETRVVHMPLQNTGGPHAWVDDFTPGDHAGENEPPCPEDARVPGPKN